MRQVFFIFVSFWNKQSVKISLVHLLMTTMNAVNNKYYHKVKLFCLDEKMLLRKVILQWYFYFLFNYVYVFHFHTLGTQHTFIFVQLDFGQDKQEKICCQDGQTVCRREWRVTWSGGYSEYEKVRCEGELRGNPGPFCLRAPVTHSHIPTTPLTPPLPLTSGYFGLACVTPMLL